MGGQQTSLIQKLKRFARIEETCADRGQSSLLAYDGLFACVARGDVELHAQANTRQTAGWTIVLSDCGGIAPTHRFPSMALAVGDEELIILTHTAQMN
ncbi:hypothetical protein GCM10008090_07760 [Arenicella chitinivorans]|uniref:Uncharacterized protein n=1 Tax=Arenicella chitinivorans TaxID=1329800 RepID=A0A918RMQ6_9GAMM|nr:hypothetical protein [Arenicella chitinivorans]GHA01110.1 hypothetical protein GCM10008090_07760 [Arenicella chitinivorans]